MTFWSWLEGFGLIDESGGRDGKIEFRGVNKVIRTAWGMEDIMILGGYLFCLHSILPR